MANAGRAYLGSYRLAKLLNTSRTCQVWEAVRDSDQTRVAIKALQSRFSKEKEQLEQLRHEYEVGKDLKHPRVIRTYELAVDKDIHYLVLEYFTPLNLKQMIRDQFDELAFLAPKVIEGAAEGLSYFHHRGWVHRDIKPDNYLVNLQGEVKLIDFSIAERRRRGLGRLFSGKSKVQGTRSYMPPEQIRSEPPDPRSDIYSFGCMVYEICSGKLPFTADTSDKLLTKHLKGAVPSLQAVSDNVTPEFSSLIGRMMAKKASDRPESMDAFLKEFRAMRPFVSRKRRMPTGGGSPGENEDPAA